MGYIDRISARLHLTFVVALVIVAAAGCSPTRSPQLRPYGASSADTASIDTGDIRVVFVNNSAYGEQHRAGYNGIAELVHTEQDSSVFVPQYAGFNLEHFFGGDSLAELFEPRVHPMELYTRDNEVLLYQAPTPRSHVESLVRFRPAAPHYIDVTYRCVVHQSEFFSHGYAGTFWASYINAPADKRIYFRGHSEETDEERWISAFSPEHGTESTHRAEEDGHSLYFAPNFNASLASHFSSYRFSEPYYYGRFHNMVLVYMFDTEQVIRFSQSPTGGGSANPAWDFQFIIPDVEFGRPYTFRARIAYKPWEGRGDIRKEYRAWRETLGEETE